MSVLFIVPKLLKARIPIVFIELVNFAIEFAQVQHNLIHDLEIPYAILDETGKLLWANSCMKEIMGEFIDMKNISTLIPDIKQEMLPDDEEEKKYAHIRYKERYYKAEIMKVCIDDFAMENRSLISRIAFTRSSSVDSSSLRLYSKVNDWFICPFFTCI